MSGASGKETAGGPEHEPAVAQRIVWRRCAAQVCGVLLVVAAVAPPTLVAASAADVLCGDTNDDAKVAAGDALAALRASIGSSSCMPAACDFSGDGKITAADALAILRKAVGQSVQANCPSASDVEFEWDDGVWGQVLWN